MFVRITSYKMRPEHIPAARDKMQEMKPRILAQAGLKRFLNALDDDGHGYVVSVIESEALSDANSAQTSALWAEFADYLEGPPAPKGFHVIADWTP